MKRPALYGVFALASAALMLTLPAHAEVKAKVDQIKMKLTEQNVTSVHLDGVVSNSEPLPVRGVQVTIALWTPDKKLVRSILLEPVDQLQPGEQQNFNADYVLREYDDPLYLKATATVKYVPTSYLQIADWYLTQNWNNLALWRIPVNNEIKYTERGRIEAALATLDMIDKQRPEYEDARRKWNLIQYTYGKRLAEANDGHEAILRLANVEERSEHAQEASQLLEEIRVKTIYQRAMQKAVDGNLRGAYRQMLYVPAGTPYSKDAQAKLAEWLKTLKEQHVWLGAINPPSYLSPDQRAVWLRRQHGPEAFTSSKRPDGSKLTTWWYLDYSHYSFDAHGHKTNEKVY